ncbi:uncharacterized protein LOC117167613 [Belonocnema kinseyi]|uniref:uncharacterized protein LOC117167613 n=1 Tax=Belonocnema kinseyi TaxID=2817044 RepID=UPI00143D8512|nr:uncharacterized protein LOC117167613 [Belonocnema kinseyi]
MEQLGWITLPFFAVLLQFILPGKDGQPMFLKKISRENRLLIFLMKMKLGLNFSAIECIFGVSSQTASTCFYQVLETLLIKTKTWIFLPWKEAIKGSMSDAFRDYPNCRAIIDCSELRCESPGSVENRILMYSSYKGSFTVKFLIAISPCGLTTFVSKFYGGKWTDGYITNDSGFLELLDPVDEVLADKGFPQVKSELLHRKCTLAIPPFGFNPQFTRKEMLEGYSIASVRIHVERAIQSVKIFKIFERVSHDMFSHVNKMFEWLSFSPTIRNL